MRYRRPLNECYLSAKSVSFDNSTKGIKSNSLKGSSFDCLYTRLTNIELICYLSYAWKDSFQNSNIGCNRIEIKDFLANYSELWEMACSGLEGNILITHFFCTRAHHLTRTLITSFSYKKNEYTNDVLGSTFVYQ